MKKNQKDIRKTNRRSLTRVMSQEADSKFRHPELTSHLLNAWMQRSRARPNYFGTTRTQSSHACGYRSQALVSWPPFPTSLDIETRPLSWKGNSLWGGLVRPVSFPSSCMTRTVLTVLTVMQSSAKVLVLLPAKRGALWSWPSGEKLHSHSQRAARTWGWAHAVMQWAVISCLDLLQRREWSSNPNSSQRGFSCADARGRSVQSTTLWDIWIELVGHSWVAVVTPT